MVLRQKRGRCSFNEGHVFVVLASWSRLVQRDGCYDSLFSAVALLHFAPALLAVPSERWRCS